MNKHEATGLAAELAGNRYWRVREVKPAPATSLTRGWWVILEHRTGAERYLIPECDTPEQRVELADVLAHYGAHASSHDGLRWYWPGEGAILRAAEGGDAC